MLIIDLLMQTTVALTASPVYNMVTLYIKTGKGIKIYVVYTDMWIDTCSCFTNAEIALKS